ncbi:PREDICTED: uncharacterized protein LOC108373639 [Rhagoletis zephyria]|uniref:uncharacterized protein LOC108359811 n=1 Tax=Rhagoletis zephyria TaxID=28612 RepID=UPI0008119C6B|nr:PREDICTED: uncharacterized protein LOC108359811 [Rhagoletis zephyria]XP_017485050.1 PREDICTED: uncharacterized protein LOC108373639 [Rhagoletis zephyria]
MPVPLNDASNFGHRKLSDNENYELLECPWAPDAAFTFPPSTKRNLTFQLSCVKMCQRHFFNVPTEHSPTPFLDAPDVCNQSLYLKVYRFLQIGPTLPVTLISSERSFLSLNHIYEVKLGNKD